MLGDAICGCLKIASEMTNGRSKIPILKKLEGIGKVNPASRESRELVTRFLEYLLLWSLSPYSVKSLRYYDL